MDFITGNSPPRSSRSFPAAALLIAIIAGGVIPFYVAFLGDHPARLLALPAMIVLGMLLVLDRMRLLMLILLFRSVGDLLFESTRFSIGGMTLGIGALINIFVILIVLLLVLEKPSLLPRKAVTMWAAFFVSGAIALAGAPDKGNGIRIMISLLSNFAIFVSALYFVQSRQDFDRAIRLVLWSSILPVLYAFVDFGLNARAGAFRLQSTFLHPNIFAFYLVLLIALALYAIKSASMGLSRTKRMALGAYMFLLIGMLIATKTRSAWIACAAIFTGYALFHDRRALFYLALMPLLALLVPEVRDRLLDIGSSRSMAGYAQLDSFSWRLQAWKASLVWMQPSHYLTGYGLDAFRFYSQQFSPFLGRSEFHAHNVYVQWFFDAGIVGLLSYLWIYLQLLRGLLPLRAIDRLAAVIVIALVFAYLLMSFSDNMLGYLVFNWYFWFTCGAAYALVRRGAIPSPPPAPQRDVFRPVAG